MNTTEGGSGGDAVVGPRVCRAHLTHARHQPVQHSFHHRLPVYVIDPAAPHNWPAGLSLRSADYLDPGPEPLTQKLDRVLERFQTPWRPNRCLLVTGLRWLGYAFNPVSFWFCYGDDDNVCGVVAEVNNTFGEKHIYTLTPDPTDTNRVLASSPKQFYVSPFNDRSGHYRFELCDPRYRLDLKLQLQLDGQPLLSARLWSEDLVPLTTTSLWSARPWQIWATLPRIHWQAVRLFFEKHLPIQIKPRPDHPATLRAEIPSPLHHLCWQQLLRLLRRARVGHLVLDRPDGKRERFGSSIPGGGVQAEMRILNWDLLLALAWDGDVALGDGYVQQQWDSPDPTAVVRFFIDNREHLDERGWWTRTLAQLWGRWQQSRRRNSRSGSRKNIAAHYDLGNHLYQNFLDIGMNYSCAIFESQTMTLEQAQQAKIKRLLEKAQLYPGAHLLEIGCGWGSLSIQAAQQYDCQVTAVTLSRQQWEWTSQRVAEAGLQNRVEVLLRDYRDLSGPYDRITSCEMLEAVGHENLPGYFACLERVLAPQGLVVLQVISVPDSEYAQYRRSRDWIQKEIFPGGLCPSLSALTAAMGSRSRFVVEHLENIGPHYATTLAEWRRRFVHNWDIIRELSPRYDERFFRAWVYYLSYCEAAFASRNLQTLQLILTRPKNLSLDLRRANQ